MAGYQGSVLPAFATGIITAKFEKWLRKHVPDAIDLIVTPFITLFVGIVLALFAIGTVLHMEDGQIYGGDELMEAGVTVPLVKEDFHAYTFRFKKL